MHNGCANSDCSASSYCKNYARTSRRSCARVARQATRAAPERFLSSSSALHHYIATRWLSLAARHGPSRRCVCLNRHSPSAPLPRRFRTAGARMQANARVSVRHGATVRVRAGAARILSVGPPTTRAHVGPTWAGQRRRPPSCMLPSRTCMSARPCMRCCNLSALRFAGTLRPRHDANCRLIIARRRLMVAATRPSSVQPTRPPRLPDERRPLLPICTRKRIMAARWLLMLAFAGLAAAQDPLGNLCPSGTSPWRLDEPAPAGPAE